MSVMGSASESPAGGDGVSMAARRDSDPQSTQSCLQGNQCALCKCVLVPFFFNTVKMHKVKLLSEAPKD